MYLECRIEVGQTIFLMITTLFRTTIISDKKPLKILGRKCLFGL